ncbi:hypothetical protein pb186bvf_004011 [Paramecium bursaria]
MTFSSNNYSIIFISTFVYTRTRGQLLIIRVSIVVSIQACHV